MILFYADGSKYIEANYVEGRLHGMCVIYDRMGAVALRGEYRNGLPWNGKFQIGHELEYYSNGARQEGMHKLRAAE